VRTAADVRERVHRAGVPRQRHCPGRKPFSVVKQAVARGAENRRKGRLSARRAHTNAPYKMDFHRETLMNDKAA
jgi:hypothetical protein